MTSMRFGVSARVRLLLRRSQNLLEISNKSSPTRAALSTGSIRTSPRDAGSWSTPHKLRTSGFLTESDFLVSLRTSVVQIFGPRRTQERTEELYGTDTLSPRQDLLYRQRRRSCAGG